MKEIDVAIKAGKGSGKILMKYFKKNVKVGKKTDRSPVTIADKQSEKKIILTIKKYFPNHNFLCEEFKYKKTNSEYKWIIDPLDGTRNFVRNTPFFGNCIALEKDGKVIVGVINMPALNLFAYSSLGNGAFVNGKRIKVSNVNKIEDAFLCFGSIENYLRLYKNQFYNLIKSCHGHRDFGDTLMFLLLAQGYADIILDMVHPWDIAAAKIIIEEAGGKMTDFKGKDTIYSGHTIATNGKLHKKVLNIFKK